MLKIPCKPIPQPVVAPAMPRAVGGFGECPPTDSSDIYLPMPGSAPRLAGSYKKTGKKEGRRRPNAKQAQGGGTGSVTTKSELGLRLTDYFDYTTFDSSAGGVDQPVSNYYWDVNQNLFNTAGSPPGGQESTFCRVRRVCVWVMPLCRSLGGSAGQPADNASAMFTVNAQTPGIGSQFASNSVAFATNTQVTNVLPTINPSWKKVFTCDLQRTFESGVVRPVFADTAFSTNQCLFQMSVVIPTDGTTYLQGSEQIPIRVKVQLDVDQPIATFQEASLTVFKNEEFALPYTQQNGAPYSGTVDSYVQMNLGRVRDNFT